MSLADNARFEMVRLSTTKTLWTHRNNSNHICIRIRAFLMKKRQGYETPPRKSMRLPTKLLSRHQGNHLAHFTTLILISYSHFAHFTEPHSPRATTVAIAIAPLLDHTGLWTGPGPKPRSELTFRLQNRIAHPRSLSTLADIHAPCRHTSLPASPGRSRSASCGMQCLT